MSDEPDKYLYNRYGRYQGKVSTESPLKRFFVYVFGLILMAILLAAIMSS